MINERSSAQPNTPTSANMQYGYTTPGHFDMINMQTMQNPNDLYSYYPASLYQPFGPFDDHNQWGATDTTGSVPPPPPGPIQYHPQMYTPSPLEMPRNLFDYPPPHGYPHYHPGFTPSTFAGPPSTGTSAFDMSWNPHNLPMQQMPVAPQQMTPIGGGPATNKKPSVYDDYPSGGVGDMLAQHMNAVDLGGTNASNDDAHNYDNGTNDNSSNINVLSSKDQQQQQHYQSNSTNLSLSSRPNQASQSSVPSGPKSYASVVSADTLNNNKPSSSVSNIPLRQTGQSTANERNTNNNNNPTSNYSTDTNNSRSNTNFRGSNNTNNYSQQTRNGSSGYNSRNQQQQQSSVNNAGAYANWSNNNFQSNSRTGHNNNNNNPNSSSTYYNNNPSSNYYERSSYSHQQNSTPNNNNKRQNSNYQQNYSSRTANNMSNGDATASTMGQQQQQQPITAANQELLETLKRTHQYNPKDLSLNTKGARFFVIKSYSEDDVHRSIKYNIWCSTEHGNKRLDGAFREREGKGPIYLFFSVNASGHFCGMAEMMSPVDYEHKTDVWQMSNKWQGKFEIKWIYVKDVPNQQFRNIRLENNDNKPVTNSRDTQEIPYEKGKLMLKTLHMYRDKTSIFDDFQYYESKQAEEANNLATNHNNNNSNTTTTKKNSSNDFNNNNMNYSRGNNSNKRQYSANKTSTTNQFEQQQQATENDEDDINN